MSPLPSLANSLKTVRANGQDGVIATLQLKMDSVLLIHSRTIESLPKLLDDFDAEGRMAQVFTDLSKCFNEFGLQVFLVRIQLIPKVWRNENSPLSGAFVVGRKL